MENAVPSVDFLILTAPVHLFFAVARLMSISPICAINAVLNVFCPQLFCYYLSNTEDNSLLSTWLDTHIHIKHVGVGPIQTDRQISLSSCSHGFEGEASGRHCTCIANRNMIIKIISLESNMNIIK